MVGNSRRGLRQRMKQAAKHCTVVIKSLMTTLPCVANILFQQNEMGAIFLNPAAFGELVVIVRHIEAEPVVVQFWAEIHPRIVNISRELYADGHCSTAAEKAVKEVESRLREKFSELKPGTTVPSKIGDVIGALISENGVFRFCDTSTTSGRDYRRGIHSLFEGIMAAYRNPAAHANLQYEKREAMEQIILASQWFRQDLCAKLFAGSG